MPQPLHIGLIGGIGPAATVVYYQRLCAAVAKTGQTLNLTIVQADIHTLIRTNTNDLRQEQAEAYAPSSTGSRPRAAIARRSPRWAGISALPRPRRSAPCPSSRPWPRSTPISRLRASARSGCWERGW